jgi:hypothetical protein
MSDDPVLFLLYCAGGFIVLLLYYILRLAPWKDKRATEAEAEAEAEAEVEPTPSDISDLKNQLIAARSMFREHKSDAVRIWNPMRGGWKRLREDGAYVSADPPDLGDYSDGWKACLKEILHSLNDFKTETGCTSTAAVEVMKSHIRSRLSPTQKEKK